VSQAIADYVCNEGGNEREPEIVIGYDTRFLSDRYATEIARVMAGNGIVAWLTRTDCPTPAISYSVLEKQAAAGIMVIASHNPPRYNGIKLKAAYGGAASPEQSRRVEHYLEEAEAQARGPNIMDYERAVQQDLIRRFDPVWAYYEHLGTLVDLDVISSGEIRVVADAMYGSGRGCISEVLSRSRCSVHEIRGEMNPGFGGIHPEPIAKYLSALVAAISAYHADVGLATDGDADRIGAMDGQGNFVDPHHIFALALRYLVEKRGQKGQVVKTVSTTMMVDRLAAKYGLTLKETPVGFNHIADEMLQNDVLIGGEESGGISIKGHIPEGDGILMGLLLMEIMADAGTSLQELIEDIQQVAGPTCYARTDLRLRYPVVKKEMVKRLVDDAPSSISGMVVRAVDTLNGAKYRLDDDAWLLIRPSGTEPVLRVYAEAPTDKGVEALLGYGEEVAAGA
jgi:alpha-D-glucose phosphate-specific phosphoglucomutase